MSPDKLREEIFVVPEGGEIVLQYPDGMKQDTLNDFQDWLKIVVRKMGRLVLMNESKEAEWLRDRADAVGSALEKAQKEKEPDTYRTEVS